jgi:uncharacterized protein (TIGR02246 family)
MTTKLELVKSYWAAEGRKDLPAILAHFAEDADFSVPGMHVEGRSAISKFYEGMIDGFRSIEVCVREAIEQGDEIAVEWQCRLVRNSGEERISNGCNCFEIRDGVFRRMRGYFNPADF